MGSELQLLCNEESRLCPHYPSSGEMEKAQPCITVSVVFCAIGENTVVSSETFQPPDGQKVVFKPQVRGPSLEDMGAALSCGFLLVPWLLSHMQMPSCALHQPFPP